MCAAAGYLAPCGFAQEPHAPERPRRHQITLCCGPIQPVAQNHRRTSLQPTALGHQVQHGIGDFSRLKQTGAGATLGEYLLDIVEARVFPVPSDHLVVAGSWIIGVFTPDGSTALTVMPYPATSCANDFPRADRGGRDDVAPTMSAPSRASVRACTHPHPRALPVVKAVLPSSAPIPIPTRRSGPGTETTRAGKTRRHHRSHHATRVSQSLAGNTPKRCRRTLFSLANEFNALTGKSFL